MGVFCEINLFKPTDEVYHPGQVVSGLIKYALNEPMDVERITTSLKGIGCIRLTVNPGSNHSRTYKTIEEFIDVDTIILDERTEISVGSYEIKFNYVLPRNAPSSIKFCKYFNGYKVKCSIKYYVRIKFERPGIFTFNKTFRKKINVISDVAPTLSREPVIYGESKKLMQLFSSEDRIVNIKATIPTSVIPFEGKIEVHYEVQNNSHIVVKSIITKLVEAHTFKAKGHSKVKYEEDIPGTETITTPINCGETQSMSVFFNLKPQLHSLENSKIVHRHYLVRIIAQLPMPHRNAVLDIPVQIGVCGENVDGSMIGWVNDEVNYDDASPTYWEAMCESKKNYEDASDDEVDNEKGEKS